METLVSTFDTDYHACLEVAGRIATTPLDDTEGTGIDEETRTAARTFLRSEFETWTNGVEQPEEDEQE